MTRQLVRLLAEALSHQREAFEFKQYEEIDANAFVDWFIDWRQRLEQAVKS